jgi:undecaprenyl-diphosphatase
MRYLRAAIIPQQFQPSISSHMQFQLWQVLVLAVVQGVTEFLPISSDGHLAVISPLCFGGHTPLDLTIVLHMGTLGSILVFYWRRILRLLGEDRRVIGLLILGTIPAVVLVLVTKKLAGKQLEQVLESPLLAGFMLPVSGLVLLWALRQTPGKTEYRELTWWNSLLIGIAQATAILPGLSRSGTTIASGIGAGLTRSAAASYSFLLAIPALAGAGAYEGLSMLKDGRQFSEPASHLLLGVGVAFVVGLVALRFLNTLLERGQLHWCGWYCIVLGVAVVIWQLAG